MSKNPKTPKHVENPKKMATSTELFARIMDNQDEMKVEIGKLQVQVAEQGQAFRDYCQAHDKVEDTKKDNRGEWKWVVALIASVAFSLAGLIKSLI